MIVTRGLGSPRRGSLTVNGLGGYPEPIPPAPVADTGGAVLTFARRIVDLRAHDKTRSTSVTILERVPTRPLTDVAHSFTFAELTRATQLVVHVGSASNTSVPVTLDTVLRSVSESESNTTARSTVSSRDDRDLLTVLLLAVAATS